MKLVKITVLLFVLGLMSAGCGNEPKETSSVKAKESSEVKVVEKIRPKLKEDIRILHDNLQKAMRDTITLGNTSDFGSLSQAEYDEKINFIMAEDKYFGYAVKTDEYTDEEIAVLDDASDATMLYLSFLKSDILGNTSDKELQRSEFNDVLKSMESKIK
jgi:hypothetical protein